MTIDIERTMSEVKKLLEHKERVHPTKRTLDNLIRMMEELISIVDAQDGEIENLHYELREASDH